MSKEDILKNQAINLATSGVVERLLKRTEIAKIEREARMAELNSILTKMPETRNVYVRVNANGVGTLSEISDYLEARIKELESE